MTDTATDATTPDPAEREIRAQEERRCRAVSGLDLAELDLVLADDLTHTHVTGLTQTKDEYLRALGDRPRVVTRSGLSVQVLGDVAVMRGLLENRFAGAAADAPARRLQVLQVWVRRGSWQLLAFSCAGPVGGAQGTAAPSRPV